MKIPFFSFVLDFLFRKTNNTTKNCLPLSDKIHFCSLINPIFYVKNKSTFCQPKETDKTTKNLQKRQTNFFAHQTIHQTPNFFPFIHRLQCWIELSTSVKIVHKFQIKIVSFEFFCVFINSKTTKISNVSNNQKRKDSQWKTIDLKSLRLFQKLFVHQNLYLNLKLFSSL